MLSSKMSVISLLFLILTFLQSVESKLYCIYKAFFFFGLFIDMAPFLIKSFILMLDYSILSLRYGSFIFIIILISLVAVLDIKCSFKKL